MIVLSPNIFFYLLILLGLFNSVLSYSYTFAYLLLACDKDVVSEEVTNSEYVDHDHKYDTHCDDGTHSLNELLILSIVYRFWKPYKSDHYEKGE